MAILNINQPVVLCEGYSFNWSDVPVQMLKYKPLSVTLWDSLPQQAQEVVSVMWNNLEEGYKNTLLDFKVRELNVGDCGCPLEGWHIDVTRNPNHEGKPDRHMIYSTVVGTEFMTTPITTDSDDFAQVHIPDNAGVWQAPADSIVIYDRLNMHRGPVVQQPCRRVLIRLTQTDII